MALLRRWHLAALGGAGPCLRGFLSVFVVWLMPGIGAAATISQPVGSLTALAEFSRPAAATASTPVVLFLHDSMGHAEGKPMPAIRGALVERGFVVLTPTLTLGLDRRAGPFDCRQPFRAMAAEHLAEIDVWVRALRTAGYRSIWIGGLGEGANLAARYLASAGKAEWLTGGIYLSPTDEPDGQGMTADAYAERFGVPLGTVLPQAERLVAAGRGAKGFDAPGFLECRSVRVTAASFIDYYGASPDRDTVRLIPRVQRPQIVIESAASPRGRALIERVSDIATPLPLKVQLLTGALLDPGSLDEIADAIALFVARANF